MGKLLSVNVSQPKEVEHKGKVVRTGIFKEPVEGRVFARKLNLDGDGQADLIGHGGEMRAVYVYSKDNYSYWEKELNRESFPPGQFGENFTVEGMDDEEIHVGDRFRIGTALFEVSQPRVPCYKLAIKMESETFYSQILKSGKLGFYFRVIEEGEVGAGDEIIPISRHELRMNINEVNALMYFDKENYDGFRKALQIEALSPGWRMTFEDRLAKESINKEAKSSFRSLKVTEKIKESDNVTSFYLEDAEGSPLPNYLPGQFLPLKLDIPGQYQEVLRTYTISNAPSSNQYRLSIKREPAPMDIPNAYPGVSSNYFHDQVEIGQEILAGEPRGDFYLNQQRDTPVILISAGVGITPMISMLDVLIQEKSQRLIYFIHSARNGAEHAFKGHLKELADNTPNLKYHLQYSQPSAGDQQEGLYDQSGRLTIEQVSQLLNDKSGDYYVCGPASFMESILSGLVGLNINADNIHYEFFGPAQEVSALKDIAQPKKTSQATDCCDDLEVSFAKSDISTQWNPSMGSILDLAEAEGLSPDYSCRSGICQTCQCKLIEGEVEYELEPLQEPEEGTILVCIAKPKTKVIVDL